MVPVSYGYYDPIENWNWIHAKRQTLIDLYSGGAARPRLI